MDNKEIITFAVLSDSHGRLKDSVLKEIKDAKVDGIIHCGDIDSQKILTDLDKIAPIYAVRGNMDLGDWAKELPETGRLNAKGVNIYVVHNQDNIDIDLKQENISVVIYGHTHQPSAKNKDGIVFLNPGSVSKPKTGFPASLVIFYINKGIFDFKFIMV